MAEHESLQYQRMHASVRFGPVGLIIGAIGVVFGDIGTSPLYALKAIFALDNQAITPSPTDVYGVISMVFWAVTLIVSIKYVVFVLRADNNGEGGVMALAALVRRATRGRARLLPIALVLGVIGAGLFYGDSVITPAISVLSAIEGLEVVSPGLVGWMLPIGVAVLVMLFVTQRFGTRRIGRLFGPVMLVWFIAIAAVAIPHIVQRPSIVGALSPTYAAIFTIEYPGLAFVALGAVVLAITGAEALYADMGHFGRPPIRRAWFFVVFPCLLLNYLGQGALILANPAAAANSFFLLCPSWALIPMVVLATIATVVASQAVISGAYSVSRQAMRLGFLPALTVRHTSPREVGQIYMPAVNWVLLAGVLALMFAFPSSERLASAYGLAVTGTFVVSTCLLLMVARAVWRWPTWKVAALGTVFLIIESVFLAGNIVKIHHGGWIPVVIAIAVITIMVVWQKGRHLVIARRIRAEGPLQRFVTDMRVRDMPRVPGTAVFPHPTKRTTPIALKTNTDFNRVLHQHVVIVSVAVADKPYVPVAGRIQVDDLGYGDDNIIHLTVTFGFQQEQDIPLALSTINDPRLELAFDFRAALYFLSRFTLSPGSGRSMSRWQKRLFIGLAHNAANPAERFHLPTDRTVIMGSYLDL